MRKNLIIARIATGLTQKQFADMLKVSETLVCMIETGKRTPTVNFQRKARAILNNGKSDLFFNS